MGGDNVTDVTIAGSSGARAASGRSAAPPAARPPTLDFGAIRVDLADGAVDGAGAVFMLPRLELGVLRYLAQRPDRVVTRDELLAAVWDYRPGVVTRAVDTTISRLRRRLGAGATRLRAVHGEGYSLEIGRASCRERV